MCEVSDYEKLLEGTIKGLGDLLPLDKLPWKYNVNNITVSLLVNVVKT